MPRYSLFGIRLQSDFPFENRMVPGDGPPDVVLAGEPVRVPDAPPTALYESPYQLPDGRTQLAVAVYPQGDLFTVTDVARFFIAPARIAYELLDPQQPHSVEILTLGTVMSIWLERQGLPALHAAAAVVGGRAVGFLATNKGGKTSLAASLMQCGHPLLTDDILPLEASSTGILGRPGYPQMRMWPDQASHFLGRYESLEIVHPAFDKRRVPVGPGDFGSFQGSAAPLARLYLPERGGDALRVERLPLGQAVMALIEQSFLLGVPEAMGLEAARFRFFARLAQQVPVCRLLYPDGVERLPEVRAAILRDLA